MAILTPAWEPILLPGECAPFGVPLFQPVAGVNNAVLVVGGPLKLHILHIHTRQELWYTIPAHHWIEGFTVQGESLYVQDGPVLSGWNLRFGGCFAAVNLVTGGEWVPSVSANLLTAPPTLPPPPDWIFELNEPELIEQQTKLNNARRAAAWATLLEEADYLQRMSPAARPFPNDFIGTLGKWITRTSPMGGSRKIWEVRGFLDKVRAEAGSLVFSAPVVRNEPMQGQAVGEVFVLGQDGTLHAFNAMLSRVSTGRFTAPARAQLAMAEIRNASGSADCRLYYVNADGGITAIDGSVTPPVELSGWAPIGPLQRERLLPLRYVNGRLFGGGIFGTDFFSLTPDPGRAPVLTMNPDLSSDPVTSWLRGWWDYDIASSDKMLMLNGSSAARQMSYATDAKEPRRGDAFIGIADRTAFLFWPGTGKSADPSYPLLALGIGGLGRGGTTYEVYLGNPVDSEDPTKTPLYPPASIKLDSGFLRAGTSAALSDLAWIRCRPTLAQNVLYCVARSATISQYFVSMFVADGTGMTLWQRIQAVDPLISRAVAAAGESATREVKARPDYGRMGPDQQQAAIREAVDKASFAASLDVLGAVPLPPLVGAEAVVAFSLAGIRASVRSAADAGLARLAEQAKVFRPGPPR